MTRRAALLLALHAGLSLAANAPAADLPQIQRMIERGQWQEAGREIEGSLAQTNLDFAARQNLLFQQERMQRMRVDFSKTREQILKESREIVPDLSEELFGKWETAGSIERLSLDGQPWYFNRAAGNLFRVNPEARALKAARQGSTGETPAHRLENLRQIIAHHTQTGEKLNTPKNLRLTFTVTVKADVVPAGEILQAWLPFPHSGGRQKLVKLVSMEPRLFVTAPRDNALSSVYLEKAAVAGKPTVFKAVYDYTSSGYFQPIDAQRVRPTPANHPTLAPFMAEQPPHMPFNPELRTLAREIVGEETNPYLKARRIFQWVDEHVPWAGAREYSTLDSLAMYAYEHRWGDCGIQTMLFMTLCRLNGIPTRWESGWTTGKDKNMHDWCQIYLAPYGWVPADVSYGLVQSTNELERWFFLGGIDSFRLVLNTDHTQPLYPAKTFFRSEIVDFQRGEVEWRGGNLYFNQWGCSLEIEEVKPDAIR